MVGCDILDWKCILVNEIAGSAALAMLLLIILYLIISSKIRLGFETTIVLGVFVILTLGSIIVGLSLIYTVIVILVGMIMALTFLKLVGNR